MPARVVRPGAVLVSIAYAAVMVYLTLLVAFFGLAAVYAYTGAPVLLEVEKGYKTTVTPAPLLYALALTTAPLYLWRGYTSYTRGNKRALLIDPITAALIALAIIGAVAIGGSIIMTGYCANQCVAVCSTGTVKNWEEPSLSLSILGISVNIDGCKCECKP
ncbi:hypothetical protein IG193_01100 [Infirmifilum lucidum]|uniref:Uncharacterized protein n=1 Tax=Infirmifilum lucidum TaxID=2776706 RepID=A0A7L9FJI7_9CREN|nr:hypothetical protein [Infirmifilum lucidum]QOJ79094.1 hypothetical protein IG193_01100 [Infirmifilum lucidum]